MEILERTPAVLDKLLRGLPDHWSRANEGAGTWSAYDVVGHLIHGEHTDWMERLHKCLSEDAEAKKFRPFDRTAMFTESMGRSLEDLLDEFAALRLEDDVADLAEALPGLAHDGLADELLGELLVVVTGGHTARLGSGSGRHVTTHETPTI